MSPSTSSAGKVVSAVCHGPAGLTVVKDKSGKQIVAGRKVSCFLNTEEKLVGKDAVVPYSLEDEMKKAGAEVVRAGECN